jgi:hypothetical protein
VSKFKGRAGSVNVLPGSPGCGDASACLKLRIPVIRRGCPAVVQFECRAEMARKWRDFGEFAAAAVLVRGHGARVQGAVLSRNEDAVDQFIGPFASAKETSPTWFDQYALR